MKFAKSEPDTALAEMDRHTISKEIDKVKEVLPEPSEEEKLLDQQYKEELQRRVKRKKVMLTVVISIGLFMATVVGLGVKYGFTYLLDTVTGKESKALLEGEWVNSAYGFPPIFIDTPVVLQRQVNDSADQFEDDIAISKFKFESLDAGLFVDVGTITYVITEDDRKQYQDDEFKAQRILQTSEAAIQRLEANGAKDIIVKRDQYITPNAAEGLKTFGNFNTKLGDETVPMEYAIFIFMAENVTQTISISWKEDDSYLDEVSERIINSLELVPDEEEEED